MNYLVITDDYDEALFYDQLGISKIFFDREFLGKRERQRAISAHFAIHDLNKIQRIAADLVNAQTVLRINPLNSNTHHEVSQAVDLGIDYIMLPMFLNSDDVLRFLSICPSRQKIIFLVETSPSLETIESWVIHLNPLIHQIHIGLNDLSLSYGYPNLFYPIALMKLDNACKILGSLSISFGVGGLGSFSPNAILSPFNLLGEHVRLGSTAAILSRSFRSVESGSLGADNHKTIKHRLKQLRACEAFWRMQDQAMLMKNSLFMKKQILNI